MAFYDAEEDQDQQAANAQGPGVPTQSGSSVITGAQGSGGSSAPQAKSQAPDRPGNFVNLKDYLNANKSQAGKLGDQTANVINQSATSARDNVSALNQEASQKIQPTQFLSSDISNRIRNNAESLSGDERQGVKNTEKATYQGPSSYADLNSYQAASDATKKATANIDNSGTEQGRMGLISQINSKPRTQGMNVFDNALLQSGGGREKLSQAANANRDVRGALDSSSQDITGKIGRADDPSTPDVDESTGAIGQTNKARLDSLNTVQEALGAWRNGFQPKVSQAQQTLSDTQNRLTQDIANDPLHLNDETMSTLGLNRGDRIFGADLNSYLNPASPSDITAANVASPEDYARYGALADLAGEQNLLLDPNNAGQAGTAPKASANSQKLRSDIEKAKQAYDSQYSSARAGVLDPSFMSGVPGEPGGYEGAGSAIGSGLSTATPEELESKWLPAMKNFVNASPWNGWMSNWISGVEKSLDQWKKNQKYNNVVNGWNGQDEAPTFSGRIIKKV
jgi:hypothetical protein